MNIDEIIANGEEKSRPIVILDSGLGGLNVLEKLRTLYPIENFVLFYDNEFSPYGTKNEKILGRRVSKIIKQISRINPKIIVLACNTLDALTQEKFEGSFPMTPIFGVINPTATAALEVTKTKKIALLATRNTVSSQKYIHAMIKSKNVNLYALECLRLATAIENNDDVAKTLQEEIKPLTNIEFDTIILGCTHYHYVKSKILKLYPYVNVIDSSEILIESIQKNFPENLQNRAEKQKTYVIMTEEDQKTYQNINKQLSENCIIIIEKL